MFNEAILLENQIIFFIFLGVNMNYFLNDFNKKLDTVSFFVEFEKKITKYEQNFMILLMNEFEKNRIGNKLILNIKKSIAYFKVKNIEELMKIFNSFINKTVKYRFEEKENEKLIVSGVFSLLSSAKYNETSIELVFPNEFEEAYVGSNIFGRIHLTTLIRFRLDTSIRFYLELIKHTENNGTLEFSLKNLKNTFDIKDSYDRFYDFEKNIIKPMVEEINFYSEYRISYEKIKAGTGKTNKIVALKFDFCNEVLDEIQKRSNELMILAKEKVEDFTLVLNSLIQYLKTFGYIYVKDNLNFALEHSLEDFDSFFISALKKNYAENYFEIWTREADKKYELLVDISENFSNIFKLETELYKKLSSLKFYYDSDFISEFHQLKTNNKLEFSDGKIKIFVEFNKNKNSYIKIYKISD